MPGRDPNERYSDATKLANSGDLAAAIAALKSLIKPHPDFYQGWLLLSKYLFQSNQYSEAMYVANNAEKFDPLGADFNQIQLCMQQQSIGDAQRIARKMIEKVPGHPRAIFTLAQIGRASCRERVCMFV